MLRDTVRHATPGRYMTLRSLTLWATSHWNVTLLYDVTWLHESHDTGTLHDIVTSRDTNIAMSRHVRLLGHVTTWRHVAPWRHMTSRHSKECSASAVAIVHFKDTTSINGKFFFSLFTAPSVVYFRSEVQTRWDAPALRHQACLRHVGHALQALRRRKGRSYCGQVSPRYCPFPHDVNEWMNIVFFSSSL